MPRQAGRGFGAPLARQQRRRRPSLQRMNAEKLKVQLQGDHGELWEAVQRVVLGGAATSPEDMLRARFTAMRVKDAEFMAKTECGRGVWSKLSTRMQMWEETLGIKAGRGETASIQVWENLKDLEALEVVQADGSEVIYKFHCGAAGYLHEHAVFKQDPTFGFIYSISDLKFTQWEDGSTRRRTDASLREPELLTPGGPGDATPAAPGA